MSDKVSQLAKKLEAMRKEMREASSAALKEGLADIFNTYEGLETIAWRQYAPSFNDGDPCEFSAHVDSDSLFINGVSRWDDEEEDEEDDEELPTLTKEQREEIADAASELLEALGNEFFEETYGNGKTVTLKRNGEHTTRDYYDGY